MIEEKETPIFIKVENNLFLKGICHFRIDMKKYATTFVIGKYEFHGSLHDKYISESERYDQISDWVIDDVLSKHKIEKVYLEDYSYASTGRVFHIAENTGILKHKIYRRNYLVQEGFLSSKPKIDVHLVAPTTVKKFATGKGNASKWDMCEQFLQDTGLNLNEEITPNKQPASTPVNDIVDSFYILKYGEHDALSRNKSNK